MPLSIGFSRRECWSGLPCPPPGDLSDPGIEPASLMSRQAGPLPLVSPGKQRRILWFLPEPSFTSVSSFAAGFLRFAPQFGQAAPPGPCRSQLSLPHFLLLSGGAAPHPHFVTPTAPCPSGCYLDGRSILLLPSSTEPHPNPTLELSTLTFPPTICRNLGQVTSLV